MSNIKTTNTTLSFFVNGKLYGKVEANPALTEEAAFSLAMLSPAIRKELEGREIRKRIFVTEKLLNIVTAPME